MFMKKLYGILKAALGCFLGVFLGMTTYTAGTTAPTPDCMRCNLHRGI